MSLLNLQTRRSSLDFRAKLMCKGGRLILRDSETCRERGEYPQPEGDLTRLGTLMIFL